MQSGRFRTLIEDVLVLPLKERERDLQHEIGRVRVKYYGRSPQSLRGMITSATRYEIESRARLIYKAATHVLERAHAQPTLSVAEEARAAVRELIERECAQLVATVREYFGEAMDEEARSFAIEADERAREYSAQVELFVAGLPRPDQPLVSRGSTSMTFNAPVGTIQTGDDATAYIHQAISPPEVMAALEQITEHFRENESEESTEVVAVVEEVRGELLSPKPNRLKIAGAVTALGSIIQTVAALEPAYLTLKAFLRTIGIAVP